MPSRSTMAALLFVAALRPASVLGQTAEELTRDKVVEAERDAKSVATSAPERSAVERALYWYDNQYVLAKVFEGWHGFHFAGGDFPAGAGTTDGVGSGVARIKTFHRDFPTWAAPVTVTVRERDGAMDVVGVERPSGDDRS